MPKTKITLEEIEYMLRFGREMAKRMETLGIQPTAVSRLTDGRVSSSYISDIRRAALGLSRRFSRLGREKVLAIADALQWPELEALESAGYLTKENPSPIMTLSEDARELLACYQSLTEVQRLDILVALRAIAKLHHKTPSLEAPTSLSELSESDKSSVAISFQPTCKPIGVKI